MKKIKLKQCIILFNILFFLLLIESFICSIFFYDSKIIRPYEDAAHTLTNGYSVSENNYEMISDDPWISVETDFESIKEVSLLLEKEDHDVPMNVYYAQNGFYEENKKISKMINKNEHMIKVHLPSGNYNTVRLDIDGNFVLDNIMIRSNTSDNFFARNKIMITNFIILDLLVIIVFVIISFKNIKLFKNIKEKISYNYKNIITKRLVKMSPFFKKMLMICVLSFVIFLVYILNRFFYAWIYYYSPFPFWFYISLIYFGMFSFVFVLSSFLQIVYPDICLNHVEKRVHILLWGGLLIAGFLYINSHSSAEGEVSYVDVTPDYLSTCKIEGYLQNGNELIYQEGIDCSIIINGRSNLWQFILCLNNKIEPGKKIHVQALDLQGNLLGAELISESAEAGLIKVSFENLDCQQIKLSIPATIEISRIFYLANMKHVWFLKCIALLFWIGIAYQIAYILSKYNLFASKCNAILEKITDIKQKKKAIIKVFIIFVLSLLVAFIASAVYSFYSVRTITAKTYLFFLLVICLTDIFIFMRQYFKDKLETVGLFIILCTGSIFALISPCQVGISYDDEVHYKNVSNMVNALDGKISYVEEYQYAKYSDVAINKSGYAREDQEAWNEFVDTLDQEGYYYKRTNAYHFSISQLVYLPSAMGIIISKGFGLPYHICFMAGKWANVWLLAILAYFSMKKLKSGKLVVLLITLIPINIFTAGNYTYDTWLNAWVILGLSLFFGEMQKPHEKISLKTMWGIAVCMFLAMIAKPVYFILIFIVLFLPGTKFDTKLMRIKYCILQLSAMVVLFAVLYFLNMQGGDLPVNGDPRGSAEISPAGQVAFMLAYPFKTIGTIITFLKSYLNPFGEAQPYICEMAYFGMVKFSGNAMVILLILGALCSREKNEPAKYPWWFRAGILLEYIGTGAVAALSMYVVFTPVGADTVYGCQGRYLLPAIYPILYVLTRFSGETYIKNILREQNINQIFSALFALIAIEGFWNGCLILY